jgi:hypothetical protein
MVAYFFASSSSSVWETENGRVVEVPGGRLLDRTLDHDHGFRLYMVSTLDATLDTRHITYTIAGESQTVN